MGLEHVFFLFENGGAGTKIVSLDTSFTCFGSFCIRIIMYIRAVVVVTSPYRGDFLVFSLPRRQRRRIKNRGPFSRTRSLFLVGVKRRSGDL